MPRRIPSYLCSVKIVTKLICFYVKNEFGDMVMNKNTLPAILVSLPLGRPWQELVSCHARILALY
jgi:hypothetical protein